MSDEWLAARVHVQLVPGLFEWTLNLLRERGVDHTNVKPEITFTCQYPLAGGCEWRLHLSEFVLNAEGRRFADLNLDAMVTRPVVLALDVADLPPFLQSQGVAQ